jgi:hypothetical protein
VRYDEGKSNEFQRREPSKITSAAHDTRRGRSFLPWTLKPDDGAGRSRNLKNVG